MNGNRRRPDPGGEARVTAGRPGFALPPLAASRVTNLERQLRAFAEAGQLRRALRACDEILALAPARPDVLGFAGTLAFRMGEMASAAEHYRRALGFAPNSPDLTYNLANALAGLEKFEEAAQLYRRTLMLRPDFVPAQHNLGNVLRALGRPAEAVEAYRRALARHASAEGERDLGIALHDLGRVDEAIAAYRRSLALPDHRIDLHSNLANALMEKGDADGTAEICERWLAQVPGSIEATALKTLALNEVGDAAGARFLYDFDRFVRIIDFASPPAGFASLSAFNAALVAHVEGHPTLKVPDKADPAYHNDALQVTGELFANPKGPMAGFEILIRGAIARYFETVPRDPPHPFIANLPREWTLGCWATRLNGQGNLDPHIHFTGYLGGVYYPLLPDIIADPGQDGAGWFELGRPPPKYCCRAEPLVRRVQPKEGRLLLFPGYFFHNTVPFTSTQRRISIAFDLMPRD